MTTTPVRVSPVDLARGMRDLVAGEAAASERGRTLSPPVVEAMWDSGLMTAFNPAAGRRRAVDRRDDRDLDRDGLAGRVVRLDRDRQSAVVVRRRGLPARRGVRRGLHGERQPRHDGRAVRAQRPRHRHRRRLPADRIVELRFRHRAFAPTSPRASSRWRTARCGGSARASQNSWWPSSPRRGRPSPTGGTCRASRAPARTTTTSADLFVPSSRTFRLFTREPCGAARRRPDGDDAGDGGRPCGVGARRREEHARRRRVAGGHQVPDVRHGVAGQPPDLPEGPRPPRRGLAGRPASGARHLRRRPRRPSTRARS